MLTPKEQVQKAIDGAKVLFDYGDIQVDDYFVYDNRTKPKGGIYYVKPISVDEQGYYSYCCPDCHQIHHIYKYDKCHNIPTMCSHRGWRWFIFPDGSVSKSKSLRMTFVKR